MEYQTNDIWLASFLMCCDCKIDRCISSKGRRKTFVLQGDAVKLAKLSREYYQGAARVDPRELRHRLTDLKGLVSLRAVSPTIRKEQISGTPSRDDD